MKITIILSIFVLLGISAAASIPKRDLGSDILSDLEGAESSAASDAATVAGDVISEFDNLFG